ncbi:hypothetical protein SLE2022_328490 [Rubroshorea leprosula]
MSRIGWFQENIEIVAGEGSNTLFWHDKWVGSVPLKISFNRLFSLATSKGALVSEMDDWRDGSWIWKWSWRRNLFAWEYDSLQELQTTIQRQHLFQGIEDR